ncbi:hypothetical protein D3C87_1655470 [compost metagenome]
MEGAVPLGEGCGREWDDVIQVGDFCSEVFVTRQEIGDFIVAIDAFGITFKSKVVKPIGGLRPEKCLSQATGTTGIAISSCCLITSQ